MNNLFLKKAALQLKSIVKVWKLHNFEKIQHYFSWGPKFNCNLFLGLEVFYFLPPPLSYTLYLSISHREERVA
jgi:hypothetical protein